MEKRMVNFEILTRSALKTTGLGVRRVKVMCAGVTTKQ